LLSNAFAASETSLGGLAFMMSAIVAAIGFLAALAVPRSDNP
jgi:hypothetical protein